MDMSSFGFGILVTLVVGMLVFTIYNLFRVYQIQINSRFSNLIHRLDRLEREHLGKNYVRDEEHTSERVKSLKKLLND